MWLFHTRDGLNVYYNANQKAYGDIFIDCVLQLKKKAEIGNDSRVCKYSLKIMVDYVQYNLEYFDWNDFC